MPNPFAITGDAGFAALRLTVDVYYAVIDLIAALQDHELHRPSGSHAEVEAGNQWRKLLVTCAYVSKEWFTRCRYQLDKHLWLSTRAQVRMLSRRIRRDYESRDVARHVTFHGVCGGDDAGTATHLGTFAAMTAHMLPGVEELTLCDIYWRVGSVHPKCVIYLATFRAIAHFELVRIRFRSVSQLAHLLSALPHLHTLVCRGVGCEQEQAGRSLVHSRSLRKLVLRWSSPAIAVFFASAGRVSQLESLTVALRSLELLKGDCWPCQQLLDACAPSLNEFRLLLNGNLNVKTEIKMDLSRHSKLATLAVGHLSARPSSPDFSSISSILSTVTSETVFHIYVSFRPNTESPLAVKGTEGGLTGRSDDSNALRLMDDILSRENFAALPKGGVFFEMRVLASRHATHNVAMESRGGWENFVKQEMPQSNARGILRCTQTVVQNRWELSTI